MYEIVNESNLTIAFDMDTQLSPFGAFGIYIKQGNHCCSAIIDTGDWWGIHRGYNRKRRQTPTALTVRSTRISASAK